MAHRSEVPAVTHYDGCYVTHHDCAIARVLRLEAALQGVGELACELLAALQPWELQPQEVRTSATRLTVKLASVPLPEERP